MKTTKPFASLSLDLDNLWSYMKTHGDKGWESFPSYLDIVVPRVLHFLEKHNLKITFFIVGQDAVLEKNHQALRAIAAAGHEIGNHSFNHEPWLHLYSEEQFDNDLGRAEKEIEQLTGRRPIGFRGPGYSISIPVLRVLFKRGYRYDASTLPTYLGPLARAYYFMTTKLSPEEKENRKLLFGRLRDGFMPIYPYRWKIDGSISKLIEIPVTTMPILRLPFHFSYVLYISRFSPLLAQSYFELSVTLCRLTGIAPSLLLHPLDFLGRDDIKELSFFPAMDMPSDKKIKMVDEAVGHFKKHFNIVSLDIHAQAVSENKDIEIRAPSF